MRKLAILITALLLCGALTASSQIKIGGKTLSKKTTNIIGAATDVISAVTLTDEDVIEIGREAIEWMDANNAIADESTPWGERLARLTKGITEVNGIKVNFKVYHVTDINAIACCDGSIRIFSPLMDLMDDDAELMSIIGHEIGHIVNTDTKDAIKTAYLASAARKGASAAAGSTLAKLSDSELGDLSQALTTAQFSQKQENAADDYGFDFIIKHGYSPYASSAALTKLVELSNGASASKIQQMFQSHPDSQKRAVRMREKADSYK